MKTCDARLKAIESTKESDKPQDNSNTFNISAGDHNTINSTINNTVNNNKIVIINAHGREDLSHLSDAFKTQCIRRTDKGFVELIEKIHFDEEKPENKNLRIKNIKNPWIQIHDGKKWLYKHKDDVLNNLFEQGQSILTEHFDEVESKLSREVSASMISHIRTWIDKIENCQKDEVKKLVTSIFLLIVNNKE